MGSLEGQFDTKLHEAVRYSDLEEVKIALQQGYDPNLIGLYQWSALHEAAHNGEKEILELLLQKKGDPNKPDYLQSRSALHYAAEQGHLDCLRMLVKAGGQCEVKDANGQDSLDLATPACRRILEQHRMCELMLTSGDSSVDEGISSEPSQDQTSLTSSRRSSIESLRDKGPGLGYVHMSVEYHAAKSTLKIRIWQLSDLLLPPPNTSMIHSIYVKSYLQPDKKKDSKRKTEELKVDTSESHIHWRRKREVSVQHVFAPATFKFTRALEYSGITNEHVRERQLQLEVCITQKYSHRSFMIGMINMSLRSAVKKLVKEKVQLIPCQNHTIPANMKVHSASELNLKAAAQVGEAFFSNPNVRVMLPEDTDGLSDKAASNPDLQPSSKYSPTVEVDMDAPYRLVSSVPKLDLSSMRLDESGYSSEIHVSIPSELESPDSNSSKSSLGSNIKTDHLKYEGGNQTKKSNYSDVLEDIEEFHLTTIETHTAHEQSIDEESQRHDLETVLTDQGSMLKEHNSCKFGFSKSKTQKDKNALTEVTVESNLQLEKNKQRKSQKKSKNSEKKSGKKSDDLDWDYSDVPTEVVTQEVERSVTPWGEGEAPVILPMETMMGISDSSDTKLAKTAERRSKKKGGKHKSSHTTNAAAPTVVVTQPKSLKGEAILPNKPVPEIIITQPSVKRNKANRETRVSVPEIRTESDKKEEKADVKPTELKTVDRKAFINVGKAISSNKESNKSFSTSKLRLSFKNFLKQKDKHSNSDKNIDKENISSTKKDLKSDSNKGLTDVLVHNNTDVICKPGSMSRSMSNQSDAASSQSSVVLEMEQLGFESSGAHVVEVLEDDISITELGDSGELFTDRSEASAFGSMSADDIETGLGDYKLPECRSPTQYMIPMQVYEVDDTDCEETVYNDNDTIDFSGLPTTEL